MMMRIIGKKRLSRRSALRGLMALGCAAVASSCVPSSPSFPQLNTGLPPIGAGLNTALPTAQGDVLGTGSVRVAMLLPQSKQGFGAIAAENFRNAADLALKDFGGTSIQIVVKDTGGTPEGASLAAQQALNEGAELILGPVFSANVSAVANIAKPAGIPVISLSNSASSASRGVYAFGFSPSEGIKRVVAYAGEKGRSSYAALLPSNAFGTLAEGAFREAVAAKGGRIASIQRYTYGQGDALPLAREIGKLVADGSIDTVFVPDAGDVAPQIIAEVQKSSAGAEKVRFIGSGQWDDPRIFRNPALAGAWYPAPDRSSFDRFARDYNNAFGKPPIRLASLGYDVASLMIVLAQQFGDNRFSEAQLTNPSGFKGVVDGAFRLRINGTVQRSFAIYEVGLSGPRVVDRAQGAFIGG